MDLTGKSLGPYQINSQIGQGGMAVIYRAVDTRNGETVALKVMLPHLSYETETRQRFHEEGENAKRLIHPNIVRVYETGQSEGHAYIAMEYAAGGTVAQLLKARRQPMSPQEALPLLYRVAAALDYAHHRGILHRDIKPSNILLGRNNQILLSDFGIARRLGSEFTVVTTTGATVGTPAYMSPEQALGEEKTDHRADIYSLGVVAYVMLTHTMPFDADTPLALLRKVIDVAPAPPEGVNAQMPPGVSYVLQRALAKNPAQRYASAGEFVAALEAGISRTPTAAEWAAVRQPRVEALPTPLVAPPPVRPDRPRQTVTPTVPPPQPHPARRGWPLLVGGALTILLLVVALQTFSSNGVAFFTVNQPTPSISTASVTAVQLTVPPTATAPRASAEKPTVAVTLRETATKTPLQLAVATPTSLPRQVSTIDQAEALATVDQVVENATKILKENLIGLATQKQATLAATPTKPKVKRPTSTPVSDPPTATPTLTPSKTPTPQPTLPPTQPATATPSTVTNSDSSPTSDLPTTVTLLAPNEGDSLDGKLTFSWIVNTALPDGYQFEPVFWRAGEEALSNGRGYGGTTTGTSLTIAAVVFQSTGEGEYYWGVLLVKTEPYQRISYLGGNNLIHVKTATSGADSSNGAESPCNPDKESC